jgi:hypothetical protein
VSDHLVGVTTTSNLGACLDCQRVSSQKNHLQRTIDVTIGPALGVRDDDGLGPLPVVWPKGA